MGDWLHRYSKVDRAKRDTQISRDQELLKAATMLKAGGQKGRSEMTRTYELIGQST